MSAPTLQLSAHFRILKALAAWLQQQSFDGLVDDRVVLKKLPIERNLKLISTPGIYVSPTPETINSGPVRQTSAGDGFGWGAAITTIVVSAQELTDEDQINRQLLLREKLFDCLLPVTEQTALLGCQDIVCDCSLEPGAVFDSGGFNGGFDVQQIVARFYGRKLRGQTRNP